MYQLKKKHIVCLIEPLPKLSYDATVTDLQHKFKYEQIISTMAPLCSHLSVFPPLCRVMLAWRGQNWDKKVNFNYYPANWRHHCQKVSFVKFIMLARMGKGFPSKVIHPLTLEKSCHQTCPQWRSLVQATISPRGSWHNTRISNRSPQRVVDNWHQRISRVLFCRLVSLIWRHASNVTKLNCLT